jgi:hypothetical protein
MTNKEKAHGENNVHEPLVHGVHGVLLLMTLMEGGDTVDERTNREPRR